MPLKPPLTPTQMRPRALLAHRGVNLVNFRRNQGDKVPETHETHDPPDSPTARLI